MSRITKNDVFLWIVCPDCGKVKQFGKYEHISITVSKLFRAIAQKGFKQMKIQFVKCSKCNREHL